MIVMISEMDRVSREVIEALGDAARGRVLIIDSAAPEPSAGGVRGGSALRAYGSRGAEVHVFDLMDEGLPDLALFDVIHLAGGDPFRLLGAMSATGFPEALAARAAGGPLAIVGSSAGAMALGEDAGHADILCDPSGCVLLGLGLVPGRIMPHVDATGEHADLIRERVALEPGAAWTLIGEDDVIVLETASPPLAPVI